MINRENYVYKIYKERQYVNQGPIRKNNYIRKNHYEYVPTGRIALLILEKGLDWTLQNYKRLIHEFFINDLVSDNKILNLLESEDDISQEIGLELLLKEQLIIERIEEIIIEHNKK